MALPVPKLRLPRAKRAHRSYLILNTWLIRSVLEASAIGFLFFLSIFFINEILLNARRLIEAGIPMLKVAQIMLYFLPLSIPLDIPFGMLIGVLMTVGDMASNREMLVLRSSGVSYARIFAPFLLLALFFGGVAFYFDNVVIPKATQRASNIAADFLYSHPEVKLKPFSAIEFPGGMATLVNGEIREDGSLDDVLIDTKGSDGGRLILFAKKGALSGDATRRQSLVALDDVIGLRIQEQNPTTLWWFASDKMKRRITGPDSLLPFDPGNPQVLNFSELKGLYERGESDYQSKLKESRRELYEFSTLFFTSFEKHGIEAWEKPAVASRYEFFKEYGIYAEKVHNFYLGEWHKRFAIPWSTFLFIACSFPIAMRSRKNGRIRGFGLGLMFATIYWFQIWGGTAAIIFAEAPPFISIWAGNIVLGVLAIVLILRRHRS